MHYFIDGYNVIYSAEWLSSGDLREQRERLLRFIEKEGPCGSLSHQVTVVFDGQPDVSSPSWQGTSQVIFSEGPDADMIIKRKVDELPNAREAVVVTNDRSIQRWVKAVGAKILSCEEFLSRPRKGQLTKKKRFSKLDKQSASEINAELKDIWKLK